MKFRGINLLTRNIKYEAINPSLGKTAVDECGRRARSERKEVHREVAEKREGRIHKMDQSRIGEVDKVDDPLEGVWGGGRWEDEKSGRVAGGKMR